MIVYFAIASLFIGFCFFASSYVYNTDRDMEVIGLSFMSAGGVILALYSVLWAASAFG